MTAQAATRRRQKGGKGPDQAARNEGRRKIEPHVSLAAWEAACKKVGSRTSTHSLGACNLWAYRLGACSVGSDAQHIWVADQHALAGNLQSGELHFDSVQPGKLLALHLGRRQAHWEPTVWEPTIWTATCKELWSLTSTQMLGAYSLGAYNLGAYIL